MKESPAKAVVPEKTAPNGDPLPNLIRQMLTNLGEDASREGLEGTPLRIARSLRFLTSGYQMNIDSVVKNALYSVCYDEMVIVKDIEVFSLCEHHLLPFFGKCHVA